MSYVLPQNAILSPGRLSTMLNWLTSGDVDAFADNIVAELQRRFPVSGVTENPKKERERIQKTYQVIFARIEAFAQTADLGLYRKARLGNRIHWALREAGYPEGFVKAFTHEVVTVAALAKKRVGAARQR